MKKTLLLFFAVFIVCAALAPITAAVTEEREASVDLLYNGSVAEYGVEEYTAMALAAQDISGADAETLKSLAVIIRTAAVYARVCGGRHSDYTLCDDENCCFPVSTANGDTAAEKAAISAAEETRGIILADEKGLPAKVSFTVCCGNNECRHITEKVFSAGGFSRLLGVSEDAAEEGCAVYKANGDMEFAVFGSKKLTADELCEIFSLPSKKISIVRNGDNYILKSRGVGEQSGFDLCFFYSNEASLSFEDMLQSCFPNTDLRKIYSD